MFVVVNVVFLHFLICYLLRSAVTLAVKRFFRKQISATHVIQAMPPERMSTAEPNIPEIRRRVTQTGSPEEGRAQQLDSGGGNKSHIKLVENYRSKQGQKQKAVGPEQKGAGYTMLG